MGRLQKGPDLAVAGWSTRNEKRKPAEGGRHGSDAFEHGFLGLRQDHIEQLLAGSVKGNCVVDGLARIESGQDLDEFFARRFLRTFRKEVGCRMKWRWLVLRSMARHPSCGGP